MASAVHYLAHAMHRDENGTRKMTMSRNKRGAKKYGKARLRRRRKAHARLQRDQAQAQRAIEALEQALHDLSLPDTLVEEIEDRLRRQQKLLGKIFGCMFPSLFGCRTPAELARVRGWDKNLPAQILGALPKRSWLKRLRRLGLEVLVPLWRHVQDKSPATHSRWQWTWVADDSVFQKYGQQLGLVGLWWSGQEKRVRPGIDGVLLVVVIGDGKLVVPVDFAIRRPDPKGPGGHCRDKLCWVQTMLDERLAALERRGLNLPSPVVVADSWFSDSKLMTHVRFEHQGTLLVEGKRSYAFALPDGRQVKGRDLLDHADWSWREHPWEPRVRYARLTATSPTYGVVTIVIVDEPGQDRFYLMCLATSVIAPQLIRRWRRRSWIEYCFRTLKHLLATEACQVHSEGAYYGHLVLRLMACFILFYTTRVVCKGHMTMEEMVFSLKHYWRFIDSKAFELQGLSWEPERKPA
jgi:hypothetical protein